MILFLGNEHLNVRGIKRATSYQQLIFKWSKNKITGRGRGVEKGGERKERGER